MSKAFVVRELDVNEYDIWDNFVDTSPQGSIYSKSWWLKAVSGSFRILVCEDGSCIIGGMALSCIYGRFYRNPKLTPALGILLGNFADMRYVSRITKEIAIISRLIEELPDFMLFDYVFNDNFFNCLPFKWRKFKFDIEYTYSIKDLNDLEKVFKRFDGNTKWHINKALKSDISIVYDCYSIDEFYELDKRTYIKQNSNIAYTREFLTNLHNTLKGRGSGKIIYAVDMYNNILGANFLAYDNKTTHGVAMCSSNEGKKVGIPSLLVWEAIKFASTVSEEINFEGSSIKNIEAFLRGFGAELRPRFRISKCSVFVRIMLSILKTQKRWIRKLGLI